MKYDSVSRRFISTISLFFLVMLAHSQTVDQTFMLAQEQLRLHNYEEALSAYHRVVYFDEGNYKFECALGIATCYTSLGENAKALNYFDVAASLAPSDSAKFEILFDKIESFLLDGKVKYARMELYGISNCTSKYFRDKYTFYDAVISFRLEEYDAAWNGFAKLVPKDEATRNVLDNLYQKNKRAERINPNTARWLSLFPGLGQFYAGNYKDATNSLLLNAVFLTLYIHVSTTYSFVDGLLSVYPWFQRYYIGGFQNAKRIAIEMKNKKHNQVLQDRYIQLPNAIFSMLRI